MSPKNRSKKQLILEKWEHFENGQNWQKYMGYQFGSKIKNAKKGRKMIVRAKPNIRKMGDLKMAKIGQYAWAIMQNGQFGSKIRNAKKVPKMIVRPH